MRNTSSRLVKRISAGLAAVLFAGATFGAVAAAPAQAAPLPTDQPTVTAEALPTWQLNGVVWSTVVVGNTAYVTGEFSKALNLSIDFLLVGSGDEVCSFRW